MRAKTISAWFKTTQEPYRTKLLNNMNSSLRGSKVKSLIEALKSGFIWGDTDEGSEFWVEYLNSIIEEKKEVYLTIREWFNKVKEPFKSKLIENTSEEMLNTQAYTFVDATEQAFTWVNTKEGADYWLNFSMFHVEHME